MKFIYFFSEEVVKIDDFSEDAIFKADFTLKLYYPNFPTEKLNLEIDGNFSYHMTNVDPTVVQEAWCLN